MGENLLTDLWQQQGDLFAMPPRTVSLGAAAWTLVAAPNPMRFTLTVVRTDPTLSVLMSPIDYGTPGFLTTFESDTPTQIHASVWPLLIGGSWYAYSSGGQDVKIIEVIRIKQG